MNIEKKGVSLVFVSTLLFSLFCIQSGFPLSAGPDVIWVPDSYPTIQAAINAANEGDIIKVRTGTYNENLRVNKTVKLIGEGFPTINGYSLGLWGYPTISVMRMAENVTISGFIIQHSYTDEMDDGITIQSHGNNITGNIIRSNAYGISIGYLIENNTISNNIIEQNWQGISCLGPKNIISGNIVSDNSDGVSLWEPTNSLINNTIIGNHYDGVVVHASNTTITDNTIQQNGGNGIVAGSSGHLITRNTLSNNSVGVSIWGSSSLLINNTIVGNEVGIELHAANTTVKNNNMTGNGCNLNIQGSMLTDFIQNIDASNIVDGKPVYYWINQSDRRVPADAGYVAVINSTKITLEGLSLERNGQGMLVVYSVNCTIQNCNISNNKVGVDLLGSSNLTIYHNNFINNCYQVETNSKNVWDNGYPSGGNYWSNYASVDFYHGPYQNETGSDGVGDTPYVIDENNRDNYPLMSPYWYWTNPIPGDINRDTKVDWKDLLTLARTYGSDPTKPNWNPNCDLNDDEKVDWKDLLTLASNYGKRA